MLEAGSEYFECKIRSFKDTRAINEDSPEFYWFACTCHCACTKHLMLLVKHHQDEYTDKSRSAFARAYAHFMLVNIFQSFKMHQQRHQTPVFPM
jgi:hypothetical protein